MFGPHDQEIHLHAPDLHLYSVQAADRGSCAMVSTSEQTRHPVIRQATFDDIEAVVELGRNFIAGSQYSALIQPDGDAMFQTVRMLVDHHVVLVLEVPDGPIVGILGIATYPHLVTGQCCAVECFWWVEPAFRGRGIAMLRAAEEWARSRGATFIQMVQPHSEERLGRVYEHLGYVVTEHQFQKQL